MCVKCEFLERFKIYDSDLILTTRGIKMAESLRSVESKFECWIAGNNRKLKSNAIFNRFQIKLKMKNQPSDSE